MVRAARWCVLLSMVLLHGASLADNAEVAPGGWAGRHVAATAPAYPEGDAVAAWRGLAASYVRKAERDGSLDLDPVLNARVDRVMARVGTAVAAVDSRFSQAVWRAILVERFGLGAAAFPGPIVIVDSAFVRRFRLTDDELALLLAHEAAHVIAGHAAMKLSYMAESLGKARLPTARAALLEFLAEPKYAEAYRPVARLQEREADMLGAAILFATGHDTNRAMQVFDKLAATESGNEDASDSHDTAAVRKRAVSAVLADLLQVHAAGDARPEGPGLPDRITAGP